MKLWCKILITVVSVILALALIAGVSIFALISHYYNKLNYVPTDEDNEIIDIVDETDDWSQQYPNVTGTGTTDPSLPPIDPTPPDQQKEIEDNIDDNTNHEYVVDFDEDVTNILLVGTDGRTVTARGRSDSMIVLSINRKTKQIVMTSLMRDIYLHIPTIDTYNRINASYSSGGISLLLDTIEENFKLHIDKYVRINFFGFENVINKLGGVDITLTQAEINFVGLQGSAQPGVVHLNGAQTLRYCRCRYVPKGNLGADFARTARQREVLTLLSEKLKKMSFSTVNDLLNEFLPQVATNLTQSEITAMLFNFPTYSKYDIKSYNLPVSGSWKYARIRGMSVLSVDFEKNIKALENYINGVVE